MSDFPAGGQQVFDLALCLPGMEVSTAYGTPALRLRGKLMARLLEDEQTLVVKTDFFTRHLLLEAEPRMYFFTDHYRDYPVQPWPSGPGSGYRRSLSGPRTVGDEELRAWIDRSSASASS